MTTEAICQVPKCTKVATMPTQWPADEKLACIQHWEEYEQWKTERGI